MVARVTLAEIDTVRTSLDEAVALFEESVVPTLREQDGFEGVYVLATPEGKALVLTFWEDEAAAESGISSGHYVEQIEKFVTFFRSPPGRETYEVVCAEAPGLVPG
jgi:heme-degrading monooxygenase HmoA